MIQEDQKNERKQSQPGDQYKMKKQPEIIKSSYKGSEKLKDKVALITGGDSGIGRSIAVHFAKEGANVAIVYLEENEDAHDTKQMVENEGQECFLIEGDLKDEAFCERIVESTVDHFGKLNIIINNAGVQFPQNDMENISVEQIEETFDTNVLPHLYVVKAALKHLHPGDCIINTSSITAYRGSEHLLDYSSTKGAIVSFTRSLAKNLAQKNIRVNGVAPGPIWTPLIPATFDNLEDFGKDTPMGRPGQPSEVAPAYVFLASDESSYISGQFIHINGGEFVGT